MPNFDYLSTTSKKEIQLFDTTTGTGTTGSRGFIQSEWTYLRNLAVGILFLRLVIEILKCLTAPSNASSTTRTTHTRQHTGSTGNNIGNENNNNYLLRMRQQ